MTGMDCKVFGESQTGEPSAEIVQAFARLSYRNLLGINLCLRAVIKMPSNIAQ
jgi:hypothetical protein